MIDGIINTLLSAIDWYLFAYLYIVAGLITILVLIHIGRRSEETYADILDNLGKVVLLSLLGWPYVLIVYLGWRIITWPYALFVWVFSWQIWSAPVTLEPLAVLTAVVSRWIGR